MEINKSEIEKAADPSAIPPAETKPTREFGMWEYVETKTGAHVFAGPFTIKAHWNGGVLSDEIRSVMKAVAVAPALLAALKEILPLCDITADGECKFCGRDWIAVGIPANYLCESNDCSAFIARAVIAKVEQA